MRSPNTSTKDPNQVGDTSTPLSALLYLTRWLSGVVGEVFSKSSHALKYFAAS